MFNTFSFGDGKFKDQRLVKYCFVLNNQFPMSRVCSYCFDNALFFDKIK